MSTPTVSIRTAHPGDFRRLRGVLISLWLDTSAQTPGDTVEEILARAGDAIVRDEFAGADSS